MASTSSSSRKCDTGQCQVIQDVADGWEGLCLGLTRVNLSATPEFCRDACCNDPNCEVWQWGTLRDSSAKLGICSIGRGLECQSERFDDLLVRAGQRITHGTVSESVTLEKGSWCRGVGMKQAPIQPLSGAGTYKSQILACRDVCYQDATCSIWQHSTTEGCWYGYSDQCSRALPGASTMVAGERVARSCGSTAKVEEHTDFFRVFGIIATVGMALFVFGVFGVLFRLACLHRAGKVSRARSFDDGDEESDDEVSEPSDPTVKSENLLHQNRSSPTFQPQAVRLMQTVGTPVPQFISQHLRPL